MLNILEAKTFHHEYSTRACAIEIVDDVNAAIDHIHKHGRHVGFFNFKVFFYVGLVSVFKLISHNQLHFDFGLNSAVRILIALLQKTLRLLNTSYVLLTGKAFPAILGLRVFTKTFI